MQKWNFDNLCLHIFFNDLDLPCEIKPCKDPNAEFTCLGGGCQRTCAGLDRPCCVYTLVPVQGCFCKTGYALNKYGVCVPECIRACQREKLKPCKCGEPECSGS